MTEPIAWPLSTQHEWWWMRYRSTIRQKWCTMLVEVARIDGCEVVCPHQMNYRLSRPMCESLRAEFVPAVPPPEDWLAEEKGLEEVLTQGPL